MNVSQTGSNNLSDVQPSGAENVYTPPVFPPAALQYDFTTVPPALQPKAIQVEDAVALLKSYDWEKQAGPLFWARLLAMPVFAIGVLTSLSVERTGWLALYLFALASIAVMSHQSDQIKLQRFVLQNSNLDKSWLGAIIEALECPMRSVKKAAVLLLTYMLPRVTRADAATFNKIRMGCLRPYLEKSTALKHPEFALAILRVLPLVGSAEDLPFVQPLTAPFYYSNAHNYSNAQKLQAIAQQVTAALQARSAIQESAPVFAPAAVPQTETPPLSVGLEPAPVLREAEAVLAPEEQAQQAEASAAVDKQMELFEAELRKGMSPGMRLGFLIASWGMILPYCAYQTYVQFAGHHWPFGVIFALLTALCTQLHRLTLTDRQKLIAQQLARLDDVRCIGRLAEALEWPDESVRFIAISALTRLLPRVKATDRVLHTAAQRANLYRMLTLSNARRHVDFMLAILKALEQIGDAAAVPFVEQLSKAKPMFSYERRVSEAARECLPYLMVRANLNQSSQTLLRGSSAPPTGADILVRAASAVNATDQEQLLRPGSGE